MPETSARELATRIVALDEKLRRDLIDVPTEDEARALRIEYIEREIKAWQESQ